MAGAESVTGAPYPTGDNSTVAVRMGAYVPNGLTGHVVDTFLIPWDCYVIGVDYSYTGGTADLDAVALKTVDATALDVVASQDMSADIAGVAQTLDSDIVGTKVVKGNKFQLTADSTDANEAGTIIATLHLRPAFG